MRQSLWENCSLYTSIGDNKIALRMYFFLQSNHQCGPTLVEAGTGKLPLPGVTQDRGLKLPFRLACHLQVPHPPKGSNHRAQFSSSFQYVAVTQRTTPRRLHSSRVLPFSESSSCLPSITQSNSLRKLMEPSKTVHGMWRWRRKSLAVKRKSAMEFHAIGTEVVHFITGFRVCVQNVREGYAQPASFFVGHHACQCYNSMAYRVL